MTYRIAFRSAVLKEMRGIPRSTRQRLWTAISALRDHPVSPGCEKIQGYEDYFKIRVGKYRIVYHLATRLRLVTIIKVGHRKDVYRFLKG